jgi:hypothetical protein
MLHTYSMFGGLVNRDRVLLGAGLNKVARQPMERSYAHCPHTSQTRQPSGSFVDAGTCVSIPTIFFMPSYYSQHCSPLRVEFELETCRLRSRQSRLAASDRNDLGSAGAVRYIRSFPAGLMAPGRRTRWLVIGDPLAKETSLSEC